MQRARERQGRVTGEFIPRDRALRIAESLVDCLRPACTRIEIGGSIRRGKAAVKDIEIVCAPKLRRDLFGEWAGAVGGDELQSRLPLLIARERLIYRRRADGQIIATGPRAYMLWSLRESVAIDLFAVLPPAQWGAVFAIRTGPAEYSRKLVTQARERGYRCEDGRLVELASGREVATSEERDFIERCGFSWQEPEVRGG